MNFEPPKTDVLVDSPSLLPATSNFKRVDPTKQKTTTARQRRRIANTAPQPRNLANMSRFFRGDSSSESSSSDEEELYSDNEDEVKEASEDDSDEEEDAEDSEDSDSDDSEGGKKTGANKFLREGGDSDSDSSEDERGQVKSAKDKRIEELEATIKAIANGEKINDWGVISNGTFIYVA